MQVRGAECVIIAGDPQQLPPTVSAPQAVAAQLDRTVFERLQAFAPLPHPARLSCFGPAAHAGSLVLCIGLLQAVSIRTQVRAQLKLPGHVCCSLPAQQGWCSGCVFLLMHAPLYQCQLTSWPPAGVWAAALATGHAVPHAPHDRRVPLPPVLQGPDQDRAVCRSPASAPRCRAQLTHGSTAAALCTC